MMEPGRPPKFSFPVAGPYPAVQLDSMTVFIRTREGIQCVNLEGVIRCPMDHPPGFEFAEDHPPRPTRRPEEIGELAYVEFVIY
jgi:hypothetical protein